MAEAERECLRYQQFFESEQKFVQLVADKDTIIELQRQLLTLLIDRKRRLSHGLVDGDIIVKPPTSDATVDISEGPNALNGWTKIQWKYNPAIIQENFRVKIISEVGTTWELSGGRSTQGTRLMRPQEKTFAEILPPRMLADDVPFRCTTSSFEFV